MRYFLLIALLTAAGCAGLPSQDFANELSAGNVGGNLTSKNVTENINETVYQGMNWWQTLLFGLMAGWALPSFSSTVSALFSGMLTIFGGLGKFILALLKR